MRTLTTPCARKSESTRAKAEGTSRGTPWPTRLKTCRVALAEAREVAKILAEQAVRGAGHDDRRRHDFSQAIALAVADQCVPATVVVAHGDRQHSVNLLRDHLSPGRAGHHRCHRANHRLAVLGRPDGAALRPCSGVHLDAVGRSRRRERQGAQALGVRQSQLEADRAAHALTDVVEALDAQRVGHTDDIGGHLLDRVPILGVRAVAGAAGVHRDAAVVIAHPLDHAVPRFVGSGVAVLEDDRLAAAGFFIKQVNAVDVGEGHSSLQCLLCAECRVRAESRRPRVPPR